MTISFCAAFCVAAGAGLAWFALEKSLFPMFLDSRIERLYEKGLPRVSVQGGRTIYCRMKADDFHFPLPPGSRALSPVITSGGFDWVDGSVEVRFEASNRITPGEYERWLSKRLQVGASVVVESVPNGLLIKFHYFGDK